jgi:hypothetical protein
MVPAVELADNGIGQTLKADALFLGFGVAVAKLLELLLESVHPFAALNTASVADGAAVGPVPSKQFAVVPKPTKSITPAVGQDPESAVVLETNATFPPLADMAIVPVASAVGSATPFIPPACRTKKYCPGFKVKFGSAVTVQDVPVELAYWTDIPFRLTEEFDLLNNSMKSLV